MTFSISPDPTSLQGFLWIGKSEQNIIFKDLNETRPAWLARPRREDLPASGEDPEQNEDSKRAL
jgi:hypothetical protein